MVILGIVLHGLFSLYYMAVLDRKTPLQDRRELLRPCSTLHTSTHSFQVIWIRYKWEVPKWSQWTSFFLHHFICWAFSKNMVTGSRVWHPIRAIWGWCKNGSWTIIKTTAKDLAPLATWSLPSWPTSIVRTIAEESTWSPLRSTSGNRPVYKPENMPFISILAYLSLHTSFVFQYKQEMDPLCEWRCQISCQCRI